MLITRAASLGEASCQIESDLPGCAGQLDRAGAGQELFLIGTALKAALGSEVRLDVVFGDELQAGVDVRRAGQAAGELVNEQHHDGIEALQVGLLVDGKVQIAL